jgi:heme exporter protein B
MRTLSSIVRRELTLAMRRKSDAVTVVLFFVLVACLFPLGIGSEPALLRTLGPGVLWVAALLSSQMGLHRLFADDHADGTLEHMALSPRSFEWLVAGKILAHWMVAGLPVVVLAPLLGLQFGLGADTLSPMLLGLLLGTPVLSLIGAVGAALTLGLRGGGALMSLLVLPLYVPPLIFGAGAIEARLSGLDASGHLALMGAILVVALTLAPWAVSTSLRIALE